MEASFSLPRDLRHVAFVGSPAVLSGFSIARTCLKTLLVECSVIRDILMNFRGSLCLDGGNTYVTIQLGEPGSRHQNSTAISR